MTQIPPFAITNALPVPREAGAPALAEKALHIALVTETWPPEVNGVSLSLSRLAAGLRARGHRLQLIRPRRSRDDVAHGGPGLEALLVPGLPIPRYPELRMGLPVRATLLRAWRERRPDIVHIATEGPLGWAALRAAGELGLPVSTEYRTNFHAYSSHYGIGVLRGLILMYLRWFHNRADCTMVPTEPLRREMSAARFERLSVVARGVDTVRFDPRKRCAALRASWGVNAEDIVLLYVGRLAAEKNLDTVLATHATILARRSAFGARVRLVLVGDGPLRESLRHRCPDAVFAGQQTGEDLARHYASGDLFAFPSLTETYGNVTPEALASGLPVLGYALAAAGELVVTGENGMLIEPGDRAAFIAAGVRMAEDPLALRRMGRNARITAQQLGWDTVVAQVEQVMWSACERRGIAARPRIARIQHLLELD